MTLARAALAESREPMQERLQKLMSRAGVASRRHAEQLILAGHVTVNGRVVTELGTKADPEQDSIKVSGKLLRFPEGKVYFVLNKPAGTVATMSDPEGRRSLRDLLHGMRGHVFPVGRLDYQAEGLILLTSDGEFADRILRGARLEQTYLLKVKRELSAEELRQVNQQSGTRLRVVKKGANPWYEARLSEARRDALRNALFRAGHPVEKLKRIKLANLELGDLASGQYRALTAAEVAGLQRAANSTKRSAQRTKPRRQATR